MKYPSSFIERVRSHFLISEVIGKRMPIRKHGREFQGLCPFHKEKTPSFTLNDEKGFYHCFGCGVHGDTIGFVKEYDNISWAEAVERLARDAGIALPVLSREQAVKLRQIESLYEVMDEAAKWFEAQLAMPQGRVAQDYIKKRGLSAATVARFRMGYSTPTRDGLKQYLMGKGVSESQLVAAGLIITPDNGNSYDRFRGRLMFPIKDSAGRVVAFGGRTLATNDDGPKYLNSPETELFKKGELLYNFSDARKAAAQQKTVIVTEGYMDAISLSQASIEEVVAPLGTAMTLEHLNLLWRLADEPVICLDGDAAGKRAMLRAAELSIPHLKPGKSLCFAILPAGEDPDSFVQKHGVSQTRQFLASAISLSQLLWDTLVSTSHIDTPEKKAALEKRIDALVARIEDASVKNHYRTFFRDKLWAHINASRTSKKQDEKQGTQASARLLSLLKPPTSSLHRLEQQLVKIILTYPQLLSGAEVEEALGSIDFTDSGLDKLRCAILIYFGLCGDDEVDKARLLGYLQGQGFEPAIKQLTGDILIDVERDESRALAFLEGAMRNYHAERIKQEQQEASVRMGIEMTEESFQQFSSLWKISNT